MDIDYRQAFDLAPIGLCLSRHRAIVDCNRALCEMFGWSRENLIGQTFMVLYPSADEYERLGARMAPILNAKGHYADDRIMKRSNGEVFWCHVTGRALNRSEPHEAGIWSFEDLSAHGLGVGRVPLGVVGDFDEARGVARLLVGLGDDERHGLRVEVDSVRL